MNFQDLNKKYANRDQGNIKDLYNHYASRKADTLLDSLTAAIGISTIVNSGSVDFDAITPQMEEAFNLSFPNKTLQDLEGLEPEQLQGIISNWKGKLFEVQVRDQLNNGEIIGDVMLDEGQYAQLAESVNQPGWDLQILNADGTVDELLQLKATESISYINQALEKYPDIDVLATSEIADLSQTVHDSGISNESLNESLSSVIDSNEDFLDMILPGLPFLIITVSEGRKVFVKKSDWDQAIQNMTSRGIKTGLAMGIGWLAFDFTGLSWVGAGTAALFRLGIARLERSEKIAVLIPLVQKQNQEILLLKESYE